MYDSVSTKGVLQTISLISMILFLWYWYDAVRVMHIYGRSFY